jgi:hypothetical protein
MAEFYLYLLIGICLGLLGWGLIRLDRIYQYPFFMGAIFTSFILPQAISLVNNPGAVSQQALERVLFMCCLCAAMCWLGYQLPLNPSLIRTLDLPVNSTKIVHSGIVFVVIGYISNFLISQLPEAVRENSTWTGIVTIYAFFGGLIYPGFTILLLSMLQRPNLSKIVMATCAAALPLQIVILYGRRETTATFILTIGLSLYYFRRYLPPRWLVVSLICSTLLIIPLTSSYRSIAKTGDWHQLLELRPVENFQNFVAEGDILELRNAALLMDATARTGQYAYGTDYWNTLVFRFVPAQLVGRDLKDALQIKLQDYDLETLYGYNIPRGSTPTGIADSFTQFDYFGCFFFFISAYFFKNLWIAAILRNSLPGQIFYISLFAPAMISVTHGTVRFFPDLVFRIVFIGTALYYARSPHRYLSQSGLTSKGE